MHPLSCIEFEFADGFAGSTGAESPFPQLWNRRFAKHVPRQEWACFTATTMWLANVKQQKYSAKHVAVHGDTRRHGQR